MEDALNDARKIYLQRNEYYQPDQRAPEITSWGPPEARFCLLSSLRQTIKHPAKRKSSMVTILWSPFHHTIDLASDLWFNIKLQHTMSNAFRWACLGGSLNNENLHFFRPSNCGPFNCGRLFVCRNWSIDWGSYSPNLTLRVFDSKRFRKWWLNWRSFCIQWSQRTWFAIW